MRIVIFTERKANGLIGRFFYHFDHSGSSSFIINFFGDAIQHLQYLTYGETFVDQQTGTRDTPYKFSGKEKDDETGISVSAQGTTSEYDRK